MHLSFRPEGRSQEDATARRRRSSTDASTRPFSRSHLRDEALPRRHWPWMRMLLVAAGLAMGGVAFAWLATAGRIHAYGIVRSHGTVHRAPRRARIAGLYVQPGDRVQSGDTLFVLVSEEAQQEADRIQAVIREVELDLLDLRGRQEALEEQPDLDSLSSLQAALERRQLLQRRRDQLLSDHEATSHRLLRDIKLLQFQLALRQAALEAAVEAGATMTYLAQVEAATAADLERQAERERQAREAVQTTRATLVQREAALATRTQETNQERERLDRLLNQASADQEALRESVQADHLRQLQTIANAIERSQTRLKALREEYAHIKRQAGPNAITTASTGVVVSVAVADGAELAADGEILQLAATGELWVDAFVPGENAATIGPESRISIQAVGGGASVPGHARHAGMIEVPFPDELHDLDATRQRAIRMRVDLAEADHGLQPGNLVTLVIRP